jgi:hypothetical protein
MDRWLQERNVEHKVSIYAAERLLADLSGEQAPSVAAAVRRMRTGSHSQRRRALRDHDGRYARAAMRAYASLGPNTPRTADILAARMAQGC